LNLYCFFLMSDDGSRLHLGPPGDPSRPWEAAADGTTQYIGLWFDHGLTQSWSCTSLYAGVNYDMKTLYYDNQGPPRFG